ncbi:hypothetical protein MBLNU230_g5003t1 [Neophaeotheca triangularis]
MANDKTITLITGANQGLGFYTVQQLAQTGTHHILMGSRNLDRAKEAIQKLAADAEIKVDTTNIEALELDVTNDDSIAQAAATVERKFGKLDCLLNNAGVAVLPDQDKLSVRDQYSKIYDTNLFGAAAVTDAFLPLLKKGSAKRLGFTSSGLSSLEWASNPPDPLWSAKNFHIYRSTKTALNMVMLYYTKSLEEEGFIVSASDPGYCATTLNNHSGFKDPRDGAKVLVRCITGDKKDVHGAVVDETSKEPW